MFPVSALPYEMGAWLDLFMTTVSIKYYSWEKYRIFWESHYAWNQLNLCQLSHLSSNYFCFLKGASIILHNFSPYFDEIRSNWRECTSNVYYIVNPNIWPNHGIWKSKETNMMAMLKKCSDSPYIHMRT